MPEGDRDSAWLNCFKAVEAHDRDLCQAYREQIDTLLVFAGLFSAVVTAFAVESYQWLQDDPADASVALLRDMVSLMALGLNQTVHHAEETTSHIAGAAIVRINIFWFVSLCLSLSAALVGILCKQWLREYERDAGRSPEKALAVRHIRFQGFEYWKVGSIVTSMPILLQIALALFFTGIVDLLWQLHPAVAGCVTVVAGLTLAFYLSTTLLPLLQYATICLRCCGPPERTGDYCGIKAFTEPQCAFKSAQAWIAIRVAQPIIEYFLKTYAGCFSFHYPPRYHALVLQPADSWVAFDINWTKRREHIHSGPHAAYETLSWIAGNLEGGRLSSWIWHCVWARRLGNRGHVDDITRAATDLECVASAYPGPESLGLNFLAIVRAQSLSFQCALTTELPPDTTIEQLLRIAPAVGVNSRWTREALDAVVSMYDHHALRLSDDVATGLLRLAEAQTHAQVRNPRISFEPGNPHLPFFRIAQLLSRGSPLRGRLLPAMCAFAVAWIEVQPPRLVESMALNILGLAISHFVSMRCDGERLLASPGIVLVAKLAEAISAKWPGYADALYSYDPPGQRILVALLGISRARNGDPGPDTATLANELGGAEHAHTSSSSVGAQLSVPVVTMEGIKVETALNAATEGGDPAMT